MKTIRITKRGVFREGGQMVPIGSEVTVPNGFTGWNGKWVEVSSDEGKSFEVATPAPVEQPAPEDDESLASLRDEYERVLGKRPGPRMKEDTMHKHIEEAQEQEGGSEDE